MNFTMIILKNKAVNKNIKTIGHSDYKYVWIKNKDIWWIEFKVKIID